MVFQSIISDKQHKDDPTYLKINQNMQFHTTVSQLKQTTGYRAGYARVHKHRITIPLSGITVGFHPVTPLTAIQRCDWTWTLFV